MLEIRKDRNGNKILYYSNGYYRGFSVQTNGNLPETHKMNKEDFSPLTAQKELNEYVEKYGTEREKGLLGIY